MPDASQGMVVGGGARKKARLPKGFESIDGVLLTEPRIVAIQRELRELLKLVQVEENGVPIDVDGFRLRDNSQWADYPSSLSDIFWHLSSVCNFRCEFCYELGNPEGFPIQSIPRMSGEAEIGTRLKHYDPQSRMGLFSLRTAINEPFANKRAIQYLRQMRAKSPDELISFVTNGSYLTEEVVSELAQLQPLFFNLSIYSTDPEVREKVILDRRGQVAVEAVALLRKYQVPYMTNLVMWPSISFEDMERTIAFMDRERATVVRVCLGGYSRYLEGDFPRFDPQEYWPQVTAAVDALRHKYRVPILIEPNSFVRQDTEAWVDGVLPDSPADLAGVRRGDIILSVDGVRIASRMQLLSVLRKSAGGTDYRPPGVQAAIQAGRGNGTQAPVQLVIHRDGQRVEAEVQRHDPRSMETYPYGQIADFRDFMFGLVITDSLRYSSLKAARDLIVERGAQRVLLLTSVMIEPLLGYMLGKADAFRGLEVDIRVAKNGYFGGSINIGDLLVVDDFIAAVREYCADHEDPDLVLIPGSPFASSPWGRDLTGRPWQDIERVTGVPLALIPTPNITF